MFCGPSKKALLPGNPKRRQRLAAALVKSRGPETKSQAAFKKDYESRKLTAAKEWSKSKLEKEEKLFQMKREKRKKKHKGR
jgi:ribosomal protein L14E/L6E/L27E